MGILGFVLRLSGSSTVPLHFRSSLNHIYPLSENIPNVEFICSNLLVLVNGISFLRRSIRSGLIVILFEIRKHLVICMYYVVQ